jgi:hypothetical protein
MPCVNPCRAPSYSPLLISCLVLSSIQDGEREHDPLVKQRIPGLRRGYSNVPSGGGEHSFDPVLNEDCERQACTSACNGDRRTTVTNQKNKSKKRILSSSARFFSSKRGGFNISSNNNNSQRVLSSSTRFFGSRRGGLNSNDNQNLSPISEDHQQAAETEGLLDNYSQRMRTSLYTTTSSSSSSYSSAGSRRSETVNDSVSFNASASASYDDDRTDVGSLSGSFPVGLSKVHQHPVRPKNRLLQQVRNKSQKFGAAAGRIMERSWSKLKHDEDDMDEMIVYDDDDLLPIFEKMSRTMSEETLETTNTKGAAGASSTPLSSVRSEKQCITVTPPPSSSASSSSPQQVVATPPSPSVQPWQAAIALPLPSVQQPPSTSTKQKEDNVVVKNPPPIRRLVIQRSSGNVEEQFYNDIISTRPRYSNNLERSLARRVLDNMLSSRSSHCNESLSTIPSDLKSRDSESSTIHDESILAKYQNETVVTGVESSSATPIVINVDAASAPIPRAPERKCLVLMMDPELKIFEIVQLAYQPDTSTVGDILKRLQYEATDPRLGNLTYTGLAHQGRNIVTPSVPLELLLEADRHAQEESLRAQAADATTTPSIPDAQSQLLPTTSLLLPVPELFTALEVEIMSRHILKSPKVGLMLELLLGTPTNTSVDGSSKEDDKLSASASPTASLARLVADDESHDSSIKVPSQEFKTVPSPTGITQGCEHVKASLSPTPISTNSRRRITNTNSWYPSTVEF